MKKITVLILAICSITTFGQVTYNSTDFAQVNENQVVSRTSIGLATLDFAVTGTNFSWNYSSLTPSTQETVTYINPNSTPYKPAWCLQNGFITNCNTQFNNNFNLANNAAEGIQIQGYGLTNVIEYSKITPTLLSSKMLGATISVGGVSVPITITYFEPDIIYNFPINYNNNNVNNSSYTIDLNSLGIPLSYSNVSQRTNLVEGWGSLTTPFGVFPNVLKMKTTLVQNNTVTIQGETTPFTRTTITYKWFDTAYGIPVLEVSGDVIESQWIPTKATYVDNQQCLQPVALFAYLPIPADYNPTTQSSTVSFINVSANYDTSSWDFGDGSAISTETNPTHTFTCPGLKQVTLTITNTFCNPLQTNTITLPLNITDSQNSYTTNVTISGNTLTADRNLSGTTYQWIDCATNTPINGQTGQSFSPPQSGSYAVQLTTNGCQSTSSCYTFTLCVAPNAFFSYSPLPADYNPTTQSATISFANASTNYTTSSWDFGDGSAISTETNPTHTFTCPGLKQVTLTVTNTFCNPVQTSVITIPVDITDTQNSFTTNVTISGTTLTADRNLSGTTYQWIDCATNTPINGQTGQSFSPPQSGSYAVQLTTNGCQSTSSCYTFTLCVAPNAFFSYSPLPADYNPTTQSATISFTNASTNYTTSSWNFGDGSAISTETNPTHTFTCPGLKQVTLTVTNTFCNPVQTNTITLPLNITDSQNSYTTNVTISGNTLTADRNLSGTTYQWIDCATNTPINGQTGQSFSPPQSGSYAVQLTTNGCQSTSSCYTFTLCVAPNAFFSYSPIPADYNPTTQSATISFANASTNYTTSSWNFGDGSASSTETNPTHTFTCPGLKQVTLTVTNTFCNPVQTSVITIPVDITDTQNSFTTNVTVNGNTLTADRNLSGTTYQWLDCDNNNAIITGETNQSFTPTQSGNYAVQLTTNGCQSVSICYNVQVLSTANFNALSEVVLYPNPTSGIIKISDTSLEVKKVLIYNSIGILVAEKLDISSLSHGVYLVKIETNKGDISKKIIKI